MAPRISRQKIDDCAARLKSAAPAAPIPSPRTANAHQAVYNYAADAGHGSHHFSTCEAWRAALLGGVAAGALFFGHVRGARAECAASGTTLNCYNVISGNSSPGVVNGGIDAAGYSTLNVYDLDANIAPDTGVDGINFKSAGNLSTISSTTDNGPYSISVNGTGADGIFAESIDGGSVAILHTGDILSENGRGAYARSNSANSVTVEVIGNIHSYATAIFAHSDTGTISVDSTGSLVSDAGIGIEVTTHQFFGGNIEVDNYGSIKAYDDAISAFTNDGTVIVDSIGDLTSYTGTGISAASAGDVVKVYNTGKVQAFSDGIRANSVSEVTIVSGGDIITSFGSAISSFANGGTSGGLTIESKGDLQGEGGIGASTFQGFVTINSTGDIIATRNSGIGASTSLLSSDVKIYSEGTIQSAGSGISAFAQNSTVNIENDGNIDADGFIGIYGNAFGDVNILSEGAIHAKYDGIRTYSRTGAILLDSTGDVTSNVSDAILARNASSTITLRDGAITGADDGVEFVGGVTNRLKNSASISGGDQAIVGSSGEETVDNYGTVTGNVDLDVNSDGGFNAFNNRAGGVFNSGATVNLGAGNMLTNYGNLSPGGVGMVQTTALTGNLVQTGTGTYTVDIDEFGAGVDVVTIDGTADFSGAVAVNVINLTSPSGSVLIAQSTGALTNSASALDTPTVDFSLALMNADTELWLLWQPASILNLLTGPLTPNQEAIAIYLDTLNTSGPSAALQALINAVKGLPNEAAILAALDRLHPEHYLAQVNDTLHSSHYFLNSLLSCPTADGPQAFVAEGECYWAKIGGRAFNQDRTWTNIGGDEEAWSFAGGLQMALGGNVRLGFAGSYEQSNLKTNNDASSDGDRVEGGMVLKNRWGATSLAAAAFGGYGWFDTHRNIALAGIATAEGRNEIAFGGLHTRLSHLLAQPGGWYVKPMVDLDATYLDYGGFQERGGGAANLAVQGNSDWVLSASPALEVGGQIRFENGNIVRPFVRVGATFYNDTNFVLTSSFLSAPAGVGPFTINSQFDRVFFDVAAGVDMISIDGINVKLNYEGRFSEDSEMHAGGAKLGVKF